MIQAAADGWSIVHHVAAGETIFSLSRRYHVPPAILAEANGKTYADGLMLGSILNVPLGAYNMLTDVPPNGDEAKPIYYTIAADDKLYRISRKAGVSQRMLSVWNHLPGNEPAVGSKLLVGWVRFDATPVTPPGINPRIVPAQPQSGMKVTQQDTPKYVFQPVADTNGSATKPDAPPTLAQQWAQETADGMNARHEKGSAGFFSLNSTTTGASVYAFHNTAARGTIIQVRNLNNDRVIYVKVLGPMPETKQYAGCIIGLSSSAKAALGIRETKAFCELSYLGY